MAWQYHTFEEQSTDAARLAMLRQHLSEVSAKISADVASDGQSRSTQGLIQYRKDLVERMAQLERDAGIAGRAGGRSYLRLRDGG